MKVLTVNIPDNIDLDNLQLAILIASKLYEQGKLSIGQAADLAGLSKKSFIEMLEINDVSIFNYPVSDLSHDVANA